MDFIYVVLSCKNVYFKLKEVIKIQQLLTQSFTLGRGGSIPDIIICHTTGNTTQSAINTVMNRNNQASYHYIIAGADFNGHGIVPAYKDGDIFQIVLIKDQAWHAVLSESIRKNPGFKSASKIVQERQVSPNRYSVSIAFGDMNLNGYTLTKNQIGNAVYLIKHIQDEVERMYGCLIPLNRKHILGHFEVNPVTRSNCPGSRFPWVELMERLEESEMTQEKFNQMLEVALSGRNGNQVASEWAVSSGEWKKAVKMGITDGSNPHGLITREQAAAMVVRGLG